MKITINTNNVNVSSIKEINIVLKQVGKTVECECTVGVSYDRPVLQADEIKKLLAQNKKVRKKLRPTEIRKDKTDEQQYTTTNG